MIRILVGETKTVDLVQRMRQGRGEYTEPLPPGTLAALAEPDGVVTMTITGNRVELHGLAAGRTTVHGAWSDMGGRSETASIEVEVMESLPAPSPAGVAFVAVD
jgi:hypothetical protein